MALKFELLHLVRVPAPANETWKEPILVGFSTGDSRKYFANPSVVPVLFGMFISWADPIRAALDNTIRTLVSAGHCLWQLWRPTIGGFTGPSDHRPMRVPQVNYEPVRSMGAS